MACITEKFALPKKKNNFHLKGRLTKYRLSNLLTLRSVVCASAGYRSDERMKARVCRLGTEWGNVGEMSCVAACDLKLIRYF